MGDMLLRSEMQKKEGWMCSSLVCTRTWSFGRVRQAGRTSRGTDALTHSVQILPTTLGHLFQDFKIFSISTQSFMVYNLLGNDG